MTDVHFFIGSRLASHSLCRLLFLEPLLLLFSFGWRASDGAVSSFAQVQPAASPQAGRNHATGSGTAREVGKARAAGREGAADREKQAGPSSRRYTNRKKNPRLTVDV